MHRGLVLPVFLAASLLAAAARPVTAMPTAPTPATIMDVAPTTLDLRSGAAGLLYVTNHGAAPVTVQIQAMDWHQQGGRDRLSPTASLLVSPPMVRIPAGTRQSVRVMAQGTPGHERAFRLLIGQLPDAGHPESGVQVLLQFSVPVFVDHDSKAFSRLRWTALDGRLHVANAGNQTVKLEGLAVNGVPRGGLFYLLPGAMRDLGALAGPAHVSVRDGRMGRDFSADVSP